MSTLVHDRRGPMHWVLGTVGAVVVEHEERWFCFVRAINTGERRVGNAEMIAAVESLGVVDVAAYQAAGNLTFRAAPGAAPAEHELAAALGVGLGFDCPAFLRSAAQLRDVVARCPFGDDDVAATDGRIHLTFLADTPEPGALAAAHDLVPDDDRVVFDGREWWWLPVAGISGSRLRVGAIEGTLGPMTMRTLATVERFRARFPD